MSNFGAESYKLRRNNDPGTSHAAAEAINTTKLEGLVFEFIKTFGQDGCIHEQCVAQFCPQRAYSSISSRYSGLENKGFIYYRGDTRTGKSNRQQRVMRVNRRRVNQGVIDERRQPETPKINLKEENEQLKEKIRELESVINQRRFLEDRNKLEVE